MHPSSNKTSDSNIAEIKRAIISNKSVWASSAHVAVLDLPSPVLVGSEQLSSRVSLVWPSLNRFLYYLLGDC